MTLWSRRRSSSAKCEPMKPATPVTSHVAGELASLSFSSSVALIQALRTCPALVSMPAMALRVSTMHDAHFARLA